MPASFDNIKDLMFVVTLGTGTFGSSNNNQITMQGFRASVSVDKGGGQMMPHLSAQIYGVSQSDMNAITTLQYQAISVDFIPNTISVYAIDGAQNTLIFQGNLINAWGNYQNMPDVFLSLEAQACYLNQLTVIGPSSYQGTADTATIMGNLAGQMGYTFENNLTTPIPLSNPYLPGTGIDQARALARAAGIWWGVDNGVLWITPQYTPRASSTTVPSIGPDSGLKGYPTFDGRGYIIFECLFNPAITFLGQVQLITSIPKASGQWMVLSVAHKLESQKYGGSWFSTVRVRFNPNAITPIN